ncbi:MAG: hypothetical protein LBF97_01865, partial [Elusimicrobiota bacterium]|nr:hypothetical protein [Elusimicrobiota bacterium]
LFENIDFYDTKTSKSEVIIKNFIKDLVKFQNKDIDAVFILSSKKLEKKGFVEQKDYLAFYNLFFSELIKNENIQFISMDEFKEKITNINVIQYNYNGLDEEQELDIEETNNKSPLKTINLDEQEFMISIDSLIKFLDDNKVQEYWVVIKNAKIKLEEKKNKNEINLDLYLETLNDIYKLQNILFLEIINNEKEKNLNNNLQNLRIELLEIYQKLETILGLKINDLQNMSSKNYNNNKKVEEFSNIIIYKDNKGFKIQDSLNDDYGDGNYTYPENENFVNGMLDIKGLNVFNTQKNIVFRVEMRNLHNRQKERIEGSLKNIQLDIYIDTNGKIGSGNTNLLSMRNAFTSPENAWEYCISINGDSTDLFLAQSDDFIKKIATLQTKLDYENNFITVYVPNNILSGDIYSWKYITLSCGYDYNKKIVIKVESQNSDNFFGGRKDLFQPNIIDIILPDGISQHNIFAPKSQIAEIPAIEIKKS